MSSYLQRVNLIINSDDLGMSQTVNDAIFSLMDQNLLSSATIMSNGNAFEDAVKKATEYKDKSFGIHLNITEFAPLTDITVFNEHKMIKNNQFNGFVPHFLFNKALSDAIYQELEAQVMKRLDCGIKISHIDSHHHIHTYPHLFPVLKKLQKKFRLDKVRATMNYYTGSYSPNLFKRVAKACWNIALRKYQRTITTDYFSCVEIFFSDEFVKGLSGKTLELMCHPGSDLYKHEIDMLIEHQKIINSRFKLISYNEL